jgi:hypothetical protein
MYKNTKVLMASAVSAILAVALITWGIAGQAYANVMGPPNNNNHKNTINVAIGGNGGQAGAGGPGGNGGAGGKIIVTKGGEIEKAGANANGGDANGGNGGSANGGNACVSRCNAGNR